MKYILGFFLAFLMPVFAFAEEAAVDLDSVIDQLALAVSEAKWVVVVACVVVILVHLSRKFLIDKIGLGSGVLPILSLVLGALLSWGLSVIGGVSAAEAAKSILFSGATASLLWSGLLKLLFKK